jgi:hypothetical protein
MFSVVIPTNVYEHWDSYIEWRDNSTVATFFDWIVTRDCDVLSVKFVEPWNIEFTFESEEHYHWFLLRQ